MDRTMRPSCYGSLKRMLAKYDRCARGDAFRGNSVREFQVWQGRESEIPGNLLGLQSMEKCPLNPVLAETREVEKGIVREKGIRHGDGELQDKADKGQEGGKLRRHCR